MTTSKHEVRSSRRHLRCELTDAEILQAGRQLADRTNELRSLELCKAQIVADMGGKIKGKKIEVAELTSKIQQGAEWREIQCSEMLDEPENGKKTVVRIDTGETIGVEEMTDADRQREFETNQL